VASVIVDRATPRRSCFYIYPAIDIKVGLTWSIDWCQIITLFLCRARSARRRPDFTLVSHRPLFQWTVRTSIRRQRQIAYIARCLCNLRRACLSSCRTQTRQCSPSDWTYWRKSVSFRLIRRWTAMSLNEHTVTRALSMLSVLLVSRLRDDRLPEAKETVFQVDWSVSARTAELARALAIEAHLVPSRWKIIIILFARSVYHVGGARFPQRLISVPQVTVFELLVVRERLWDEMPRSRACVSLSHPFWMPSRR